MAKKKRVNVNIRFNLLSLIAYLAGAVLLITLFRLQVIEGLDYREKSNTRLAKEVTIEPTRGNILDRTGNVYATTDMRYKLELYKTNISDEELNKTALTIIDVLEKRGETYNSTLPIDVNQMKYRFLEGEDLQKWKKKNKIPLEASAEEAFNILKKNYKIQDDNNDNVRKILEIRDLIDRGEYSENNALKLCDVKNKDTIIELEEKSSKISGLNIVSNPIRKYLKGMEASHVVGYTSRINENDYNKNKEKGYKNTDIIGQTGIERTFEKLLKGERGKKLVEFNVNGSVTGETTLKEATGGANIVLTIDSKLQEVTENALKKVILKMKNGGFGKKYDPKGASTVVMNVKTGEILAMASYPDFDPSSFVGGISSEDWKKYNTSLKPLLNRSIQEIYPPASTFKMVTSIASLNEGKTNTSEYINDRGEYPRAHRPKCWIYSLYGHGHGRLNIIGALKNSCNYFFYEMGERLGIDKIAEYAKYLGLGPKTGIELAGESEGVVASNETAKKRGEQFTEGGLLSAAIGQSYNSFTPLQMAKYISTLVNGGISVKPTIVKSVVNSNGTRMSKEEIEKVVNLVTGYKEEKKEKKEFKQEDVNTVLEGMRSVTGDRGGTAYSVFKDFKIEVGGKTGSAEAGSYTNGVFVGFAPFKNPEIAIVTIIENGEVGFHTAEVVRDIMIEYFGMNVTHIRENMTTTKEGEYII